VQVGDCFRTRLRLVKADNGSITAVNNGENEASVSHVLLLPGESQVWLLSYVNDMESVLHRTSDRVCMRFAFRYSFAGIAEIG
jgi:hypothetical protein